MARAGSGLLDNGDLFPEMRFNAVDGEEIILPRDFGNRWNVLLLYRGHW